MPHGQPMQIVIDGQDAVLELIVDEQFHENIVDQFFPDFTETGIIPPSSDFFDIFHFFHAGYAEKWRHSGRRLTFRLIILQCGSSNKRLKNDR